MTASSSDLPTRAWSQLMRRAVREFQQDDLTDSAAALTYYAALAIFPALLVLVSMIGFAGEETTARLVDNLGDIVPGSALDILKTAIMQLQSDQNTAGVAAVLGLLGAVWSASGFVGAFMRVSNVVFDVPEGRPYWTVVPIRLGITIVLLVLMSACALIVILSGGVAQRVGDWLGIGSAALTVWSIAKWPVLVVLLMVQVAILFWAAPNVRHPGFRWATVGGVVGVLLWLVASAGFGLYVANFGSYNKTYGTLAGVIVFLVWIWVSNLAILFGAEVDAELARARAEAEGLPSGREPYLELRDTRKLADHQRAAVAAVQAARGPGRGGCRGLPGSGPGSRPDDQHR
jgi:membrane protein